MKVSIIITSLLMLIGCSVQSEVDATDTPLIVNDKAKSAITKSVWNHGSADCDTNQQPTYDIYQHNVNSYILRQNKCLNFEAPFIYVLVGVQTILVLDTGALEEPEFSLYSAIEDMLGQELLEQKQLLVAHTHGHSDHHQGDASFDGHSNVTLIHPSLDAVRKYFNFDNWPNDQQTIDLGKRKLTIIPTPGHHEQAITIYDQQTKWLMTGDTLYPGYVYVKDWQAYRQSIARLAKFANTNEVTAIMGTHIESKNESMSLYPVGTTYQPNEAKLDLNVQYLHQLNAKLKAMDEPKEIKFDKFMIKPLSVFQQMLSTVAGWFSD
ncbi:MAG: MBL fold metallo-hydrolase [Thalassotalea sp.]|nr:MBL fold metallo-hydrolase [Thalassotalea sp.]